ncbi:MAG TPA: NYN domain-containing protein [Dermatophilaceae bacterium]|nr:NYN domain-containing protein [Dermatophilaceae bacterium]
MDEEQSSTTYVLVDGENVDATLGSSILGRRPHPEERPRWDRLLRFAEREWEQPVKGLFFLASNGELPMSFIQALVSIGYRPVPLTGAPDEKVVDIAIQRTLRALRDRDDDVMLVSNDGDFAPQVEEVCDGRRVAVVGFREFRNARFRELVDDGLELFDLEYDVEAFTSPLPRLRVIPIAEFDPLDFL